MVADPINRNLGELMTFKMDNEAVVRRLYSEFEKLGLKQNREKFYLEDAGHRGFSVDIGSSHGEVLIRVTENGVQIERIPIMDVNKVGQAVEIVALAVAHCKAELKGKINADQ